MESKRKGSPLTDILRRITQLFALGEVLELDENTRLWIQKPNSFEVEDARRDGVTARTARMLELSAEDNVEARGQRFLMSRMSDDELVQARLAQKGDELYLGAMNDLDADPDWVEKLAVIRRQGSLLDDQGAPQDDPRRQQLHELNVEYLQAVQAALAKRTDAARSELVGVDRADLEAEYMEAWRQTASISTFIDERTVTDLWNAMRLCSATRRPDGSWDHSGCAHERLIESRSDVRLLPDELADRVTAILERLNTPEREAGKLDAPASSSGSSETSSAPEAGSEPSFPEAKQPAAPTT